MSDPQEKLTPIPEDSELVGSENAPFLYVDGYKGVIISNGLVRFRLYQAKQVGISEVKLIHEVVAHIALPIGAFIGVYDAWGKLIKEMQERGDIPKPQFDPSLSDQ